MPLRIVYVGDYWHVPWSTENDCAHALAALGHHVQRYRPGWLVAHRADVAAADLLIVQGPCLEDMTAVLFDEWRAAGTVLAGYHLDIYRGLARARVVDENPWFRLDHVFTADGDPTTQEWYESKGVNHRWLPAAVSAHEIGRAIPDGERFPHDVVFVGKGNYHPEWPWRATLLETLADVYGDRFKHYDHHPTPIRGDDLATLYASARAVVGDSLSLPGHRNYWSDRVYETLGRGGLLVAPPVPGLEAHVTVGTHCVGYDDWTPAALVAGVEAALQLTLTDSEIMRNRGMSRMSVKHTYELRMRQLIEEVGL